MKSRSRFTAVCILLAIMAFSGCDAKQQEAAPQEKVNGTRIVVGYSALDLKNIFFTEFVAALQGYAQIADIDLRIHDGKSDVAQQVNMLESWMDEGIDAIICSPVDPVALQPIVDQCMQMGIPFINTDLECENKTAYIGVNQYHYGYVAGEIAAEWIKKQMPQTVQVALITKPQSLSIIERANGMLDGVIENAPNATVVGEYAVSTATEVKETVQQVIEEYPELQCVVSVMDAGLLEAERFLQENAYSEQNFCIVGIDATQEVLQKIHEGSILYGTVSQSTEYFAKASLDLALSAINGDSVERIELEFSAVTPDNVANFVVQRE